MQLIAKEIYNTFRDYKADIFFVAALTIVSVVLLDFYNIDLVNNKGKRHINVITIEGYKNKKAALKKKRVKDDKMKKLKLNKKVLKYDELVIEIKNAIKQVKKENYKNYFENAYNKDAYKDYVKKDSTLKRKPKNYKD